MGRDERSFLKMADSSFLVNDVLTLPVPPLPSKTQVKATSWTEELSVGCKMAFGHRQ